jgi:polyhydroxyalkanoate synthesis repressor PhaR
MVVKKYANRRLYDTDESRYITLGELTDKIRQGVDVQVIDAKTNEDLTQATLTQIILESKAARALPTQLLSRLIRMQDDALGEFFGRYMTGALELYLTAKQGAQNVMPYFPLANLPFSAANQVARLFNAAPFFDTSGFGASPPPPPPSAAPQPDARSEMEALRMELADLRRQVTKRKR